MTARKDAVKLCRCGCQEPVSPRSKKGYRKGHHMRTMGKRRRHELLTKLGAKGGKNRSKRLSREDRSEIARLGALARHAKRVQLNAIDDAASGAIV